MPQAKREVSNIKSMSPGRKQYLELKKQYEDCLLLFRMGDFYETFDQDAVVMAKTLDIALTSRDVGGGKKSPLAGIPYHAFNGYVGKLVSAGIKIAIAEQISDPRASRGIVERAVVRVITPGTVLEPSLLEQDRNNYLAAAVSKGDRSGLAYIDVSTSEFITSEFPLSNLSDELERLSPTEILIDKGAAYKIKAIGKDRFVIRDLKGSNVDKENAKSILFEHFGVDTLNGFGCEHKPLAIIAAAYVLNYLKETQLGLLPQITTLTTQQVNKFMRLDRRALKHLEVFESTSEIENAATLFSVLNRTTNSLGARLLRRWMTRPLMELTELNQRQDAISVLTNNALQRMSLRENLRLIPDIERIVNRVRTYSASPRDLSNLFHGLKQIPEIINCMDESPVIGNNLPDAKLAPCESVTNLIESAIAQDATPNIMDGGYIKDGFDTKLDELRKSAENARSEIAAIEPEARKSTGIKSLKVGYNKVFGYYIEVSKSNLDKVPSNFERRQTLTNGERYITPKLKELEVQVLNARDRIDDLERDIFKRVCGEIIESSDRIMTTARVVAWLDVIAGMAEIAAVHGWIKPKLDEKDAIIIEDGRHPVVEASLGPGKFVPNDVNLSNSIEQLIIITGPNMSGKSTYIRQVAVLVLLAQIGSFIPASNAVIGLVDRIFTRAGLGDDIAGGKSTFMLEMVETAEILKQATSKSLAILDEIGRGTSTYDGMAIAQAVAEYIHNHPDIGCKTLFATHYHEMTKLVELLPRAANYRVAVTEDGQEISFLHRIVRGGADRSYGVHVARLAGMPKALVTRAWTLLDELESKLHNVESDGIKMNQLELFSLDSKLKQEIKKLDIDNTTPLEALAFLYRLYKQVQE